MRFYPKSAVIDAVRYTGDNDREITDLVYRDKDLRPPVWRNSEGEFCIHTSRGDDVVLKCGLWVMREAGKIAVVHPDVMDGYLPVPN